MTIGRRLRLARTGLQNLARVKRSPVPQEIKGFRSDEELLEAALQMLFTRWILLDAEANPGTQDAEIENLTEQEKAWTQYWHESITATGDATPIAAKCSEARLGAVEREIVALLILNELSLLGRRIGNCSEVVDALGFCGMQAVGVFRMLSEFGALHKANLITGDDAENICERRVVIEPSLVDRLIHANENGRNAWEVSSEAELLSALSRLTTALRRKAEMAYRSEMLPGSASKTDSEKAVRTTDRLFHQFMKTLDAHPDWRISRFVKETGLGVGGQALVVLALLGKALGQVDADSDLFLGRGLSAAASKDLGNSSDRLVLLKPTGTLMADEIIQPTGGSHYHVSEAHESLSDVEFELTEKALGRLGIEKQSLKYRSGSSMARDPQVTMDQLVLSDKVKNALQMAIAQAMHSKVLLEDWGFGKILPYGRSVTLLFSGPPGVGKTACAEALAHKLGRKIVIADYSQIQNCLVGNTEKNIVRTFRHALQQGAVLFWDEADAMLYDRDSAQWNWEVRDVNVLLHQIERFEGVCILATNRKVSLDKALERRIALKVEFEPPDQAMRVEIWRRLIPAKTPLSQDVNLEELAQTPMTGGEIKNVILNAARMALACETDRRISMAFLTKAIELEESARWTPGQKGPLGFHSAGRSR